MFKGVKDSSAILILGITFMVISFVSYLLSPNHQAPTYKDLSLLQYEIENFKNKNDSFKLIDFGAFQGPSVQEGLSTSHSYNFFNEERYSGNTDVSYDCAQTSCHNLNLLKDDIYKQYACGQIKELPYNFFIDPPYMSEKGYSFVFLAYSRGSLEFSNPTWVKTHRQFFSLPEITFNPTIREHLGLEQIDTSPVVLSQVNLNEKIIFYKDNVYLKENSNKLSYRKYTLNDFKKYLNSESNFRLKSEKSSDCIITSSNFCLAKNIPKSVAQIERLYFVLPVLFLLLSFGFILISIFKTRDQQKKSGLRKLALDNLTHDFRTPVSNMVLMSKDLDSIFERSGEMEQLKWLSFSSQVHKLHRATEETKNYIQLLSSKSVEVESVDSVADLISSQIDESISFTSPEEKLSINVNKYWFSVCLRNLIKNAQDHGGENISIEALTNSTYVEIHVIDSGKGLNKTLESYQNEFVKNQKSSGLGLGLSIVHKALEVMDASLDYKDSPTRFIMKFKKGKRSYAKHPSH